MNIDHHLQLAMIEKLASSAEALKYSDLKDKTVENSLFSYHLNKLIQRDMVVKQEDGYSLTKEGARWLNDNGIKMQPREAARIYIALVVQNDKGQYLIGQRTGQFSQKISDYILPSVPYTNSLDLSDQINNVVSTFLAGSEVTDQVDFGFMQIRATYKDGKVMRNLFSVTACKVNNFIQLVPGNAEYAWLEWEEVETIDHPSAEILRQVIVYIQDDRKAHSTPLIIG